MKSVLLVALLVLSVQAWSQELPTTEGAAETPSEISAEEAADKAKDAPEEAAALAASSTAKIEDVTIGVRLNDLWAFSKSAGIPGLDHIIVALEKSKHQFGSSGSKVRTYHGAILQEMPEIRGKSAQLKVLTITTSEKGRVTLNKVTVQASNNGQTVQVVAMTPVSSTNFVAEVGLVDRKAVFTDTSNNLRITVPIGVGSFDEGVLNPGKVSLLTPRFKKAALTAGATITKRDKPNYFGGKPFIRIVDGANEEFTAIGFHTEINENFYRGFDSHGCMRMRDIDLFMIHDLVKLSQSRIDLTMSYKTETLADHPSPKADRRYKAVLNVGTKENPQMIIDRDYLVQTTSIRGKPPVDLLLDSADDHLYNTYQYEGMATYRKQRAAQAQLCTSNYKTARAERGDQIRNQIQSLRNPVTNMSATEKDRKAQQKKNAPRIRQLETELKNLDKILTKKLEECKKRGERKMDFGDKLYRAWVH
jgi:hypothetical protein